MSGLRRPWAVELMGPQESFGPEDCLLAEIPAAELARAPGAAVLLQGGSGRGARALLLHPYPARGRAEAPPRAGFPPRPRGGRDPVTAAEHEAAACLRRMNRVLARIGELGTALDDPADVWGRLRLAWDRAARAEDPRMAEIVRQASDMPRVLADLSGRMRRVLVRSHAQVPLDRVQEMDARAMRWLGRQPGRSLAERAGSGQRILATVRRASADTPENRVLHAYARLASVAARDWLRDHEGAPGGGRVGRVAAFGQGCRTLARRLADAGIGVARPGVQPNYVLGADPGYRAVHEAWLGLLKREKVLDDLWAWQAESWTDFAVLAMILALDALPGAELVYQSPILWQAEAGRGRRFAQDRPIAVFWLKDSDRMVEIQSRPVAPGPLLMAARAHVSLRITDPGRGEIPRRVAVWTPHALARIELGPALEGAAGRIDMLGRIPAQEILRHGLVLTPAHGHPETRLHRGGRATVRGIALDAAGPGLGQGLQALARFVATEIPA